MMLTQETPVPVKTARQRINWAKLFWMLRQSPLTIVGGVIMIAMLLLMVTSPWIVPHDPNALDLTARLQAPSAQHWFGTDEVGRDLFSRVLTGSQQSITAGLAVVVIAGGIGSLWAVCPASRRARRRRHHAGDGHYALHSFSGVDHGAGRRARSEPV